jgi:hypothetical protein
MIFRRRRELANQRRERQNLVIPCEPRSFDKINDFDPVLAIQVLATDLIQPLDAGGRLRQRLQRYIAAARYSGLLSPSLLGTGHGWDPRALLEWSRPVLERKGNQALWD